MTYVVTVTGGYTGIQSGAVTVSTDFTSQTGAALQSAFTSISGSFYLNSNTLNLVDYDIATGHSYQLSFGGNGDYYELTNISSTGAATSTPPTVGNYSIPTSVPDLLVQAPGTYTVNGSVNTDLVLLGAAANVTYTVINPLPAAPSIFGGGGANVINIQSTGSADVFSAGDDTVNFNALGHDTFNASSGADDLISILEGATTVTASGNATVTVTFSEHAGANLDYLNAGTTAQTIFSGAYTAAGGANVFAPNSVTAFGGAGGGYFVGGLAGSNSLIGSSGVVTLQGGGSNDILRATGGASASASGGNVFFAGNGTETMIATAATGADVFNVGGAYTGKGYVVSSGLISTQGSGTQTFFLGNSDGETIFGSSSSSSNIYVVVGDSTSGGGNYHINNFNTADGSIIYLAGAGSGTTSDASIDYLGVGAGVEATSTVVQLTDGTSLTLTGILPSNIFIATLTGSNGTLIAIGPKS